MKALVFLLVLFSSAAFAQRPCPPQYKVIYRFAIAHDTIRVDASKHDTIYVTDKNCEQENSALRGELDKRERENKILALMYVAKEQEINLKVGIAIPKDTVTIEPPPIQPFLAIGIRANSHEESLWSLGPGIRLNLGPIVIGCSAAIERQFGVDSLNNQSYHTIFYGSFEYNILR